MVVVVAVVAVVVVTVVIVVKVDFDASGVEPFADINRPTARPIISTTSRIIPSNTKRIRADMTEQQPLLSKNMYEIGS